MQIRRRSRLKPYHKILLVVVGFVLIAISITTSSSYSNNISGMPEDTAVMTTPEKLPEAVDPSKIVYLTFDDGPGNYTAKLLDILKKYNAKATFFVTCYGPDEMIKREYDEGHTVALHTCTHDYAKVYASDAAYFTDLTDVQNRVKNLTGYTATLIRFPGGSSNLVSAKYSGGIMSRLVKSVVERGFTYFDWNVSSGDAGNINSSDTVFNNVTAGMGKYETGAVVLQHDVKEFSVNAVERILQYGQSNGFKFEALTADSPTAHHGVNN